MCHERDIAVGIFYGPAPGSPKGHMPIFSAEKPAISDRSEIAILPGCCNGADTALFPDELRHSSPESFCFESVSIPSRPSPTMMALQRTGTQPGR